MKKLLFVSLGLALVTTALGQGTVRFSNVSFDLGSPPDRLVRFTAPIFGPWSTNHGPVVDFGTHSYRAQLYYGASTATEGQLIPVTAAPALFRASTTTAQPGTWFPFTRTFTGFDAGATLNLQVRVWDNFYGTTWELATVVGDPNNYTGTSAIFQYTIPTDPLATPAAFVMSQFLGFNIGPGTVDVGSIPEPGTLGLTALGIAGLLIFRRRVGR